MTYFQIPQLCRTEAVFSNPTALSHWGRIFKSHSSVSLMTYYQIPHLCHNEAEFHIPQLCLTEAVFSHPTALSHWGRIFTSYSSKVFINPTAVSLRPYFHIPELVLLRPYLQISQHCLTEAGYHTALYHWGLIHKFCCSVTRSSNFRMPELWLTVLRPNICLTKPTGDEFLVRKNATWLRWDLSVK